MISFFCSGTSASYKDPPTGTVVLHLLGSLYPGKIHELQTSTPEEDFQLFPPLGSEKFLITEDVRLGTLVGIILQTEVKGLHPFWNCSTAIVRDVESNEAWFFPIHHEISFPPCILLPATREELCAFKVSFCRRIRREIRNGQFGYFSFLFRSKSSVYTYSQRLVTSIGLYLVFFVTCFLFLDFLFSPEHLSTDPNKYAMYHTLLNPNPIRPKPGNTSVLVLYGESAVSYWILHVILPGIISASITSVTGFLMIKFFREASKYETHFEEMDYVIGTALLEQSHLKAKHKAKYKGTSSSLPLSTASSITPQIESSVHDESIYDMTNNEEGNIHIYYPMAANNEEDDIIQASQRTVPERFYEFLQRSTKKTLVLMKLKRKSEDQESVPQLLNPNVSTVEEVMTTNPSIPMTNQSLTPRRSIIFEPGGESPVVELEIELSPFQQRDIMRLLFVANSSNDNLPHHSSSLHKFRLSSQNWMAFHMVDDGSNSNEKKKMSYDLTHKKLSRKWYQPIPAWILVIILIILAIGFITFVSVKGKFRKTTTEDQFAETLVSSLVAGVLFGTFICEPLKIMSLGFYYALKDKKIYKLINKRKNIENPYNN